MLYLMREGPMNSICHDKVVWSSKVVRSSEGMIKWMSEVYKGEIQMDPHFRRL